MTGNMLRALCAVTLGATLAFGIACGGDDDDNGNGEPSPGAENGTPAAGFTPPPDQPTPAPSGILSDMFVDANAATEEVEDAATYAVGEQFAAAINIQVGGSYQGYQFDLSFQDEVIRFDDIENLRPAGLETCSPTQNYDQRDLGGVASFCLNAELEATEYSGQVSVLSFTCLAAGEATIHLFGPDETTPNAEQTPVSTLGTTIQAQEGEASVAVIHQLTNHDATITCA